MLGSINDKKKITVMHLVPSMDFGGVEVSLVNNLRIIKQYSEINFIVLSKGGIFVELLEKIGVKHINIVFRKDIFTTIYNAIKIIYCIKKYKIDCVHIHSRMPSWCMYFASLFVKIKIISSFHGFYEYSMGLHRFYNSALLHADKIIAVSNSIKEHIVNVYNFDSDKVAVIYPSVDCDDFDRRFVSHDRVSQLDPVLDITKSTKTVVYIGRLSSSKNIKFLINSISMMSNIDFQFIIVGSGKKKTERMLEKLIEDLNLSDSIKLVGAYKDVAAVLMLADICIISSIESFGLAVAEAMAMGLCIVAANLGAMSELITHGENGFLFYYNNYDNFIINLEKALNLSPDEKERIAYNNKLKIRQICNKDILAHKTLELYYSVVNK